MKRTLLKASLVAAAIHIGLAQASAAQASASPVRPVTSTNAVTRASALASTSIPESIFTIPANNNEARNPFFPNSAALMPKVTPVPDNDVDTAAFILNGITSPPKRTAMINGRTFEVGEEGEVRVPSGAKVLIKCSEIGDNKAVIVVGGQRRELRLRSGL